MIGVVTATNSLVIRVIGTHTLVPFLAVANDVSCLFVGSQHRLLLPRPDATPFCRFASY
jgi:hypothetical protein